jgi:type I restriction enzyme S subunit
VSWPKVRLDDVLRHRKDFITIDDLQIYKRVRVQLHAQGIVVRDEVPGAMIKTTRQQSCRAGDFLVAEIDAKVGGFGIVPESLDSGIVSSHYFLYEIDESKLDRRFLDFFIRTHTFRDQVEAQGSTNYAAIRPADVLGYQIPLPPLAEQKRVVARIEELLHQILQAQKIRKISDAEFGSFWPSLLQQMLTGQKIENCSSEAESAEVLLNKSKKQWNKMDFPKHNNAHPYCPTILKEGPLRLPHGWVWTTLGSVLTHLVDCVNDTPNFSQYNTGYIGLKTTNIKPYNMDLSLKWYMTQDDFNSWNRREVPKPQDIILTREAPVGNACLVPADMHICLTQRLLLLRPNQDVILPGLLLHFFNSHLFFNQVIEHSRGLTTPHIRVQDAPRMLLPLPPMSFQHSLLSVLDDMLRLNIEAKKLRSGIAVELDAFVSSVLNRAFSGQL